MVPTCSLIGFAPDRIDGALGAVLISHFGGVLDSTLGWRASLPVESEVLSLIPLQKNNRQ